MAYQFSGFFIKRITSSEIVKVSGVSAILTIQDPFVGTGISIPEVAVNELNAGNLVQLAKNLGVKSQHEWMFIVYECFGGVLDYLYGYVHKPTAQYGPVDTSDLETLEEEYLLLMSNFGINAIQAQHFSPFERDFF